MRLSLVAALVLLAARPLHAAEPVASSGAPAAATSGSPEAPPAAADPDADAVVDSAPAGEDLELDTPDNLARYEKQRLRVVPGAGSARVERAGSTLTGNELYLALGRADLAEDYRLSQRKRLILGGFGAALIAVGAWLPFRAGEDCSGLVLREPCERGNESAQATNLGIGLGSIALGAGLVASALWWFDADPVDPKQLGHLVERANWRLRRHLGVVDVAVTPQLGASGSSGGLLVTGRF
jgi:hypothetical protein